VYQEKESGRDASCLLIAGRRRNYENAGATTTAAATISNIHQLMLN